MWDSKRFEAIAFKAVPGGYVFQLPNEWLIGPSRQFLVNETQKAEISASLLPYVRWFAEFTVIEWLGLTLPAVMGVSFAFAISMGNRSSLFAYLVFMLVFAWSIAATIAGMRSIRPTLATLPPSPERITVFESIRCRIQFVSVFWLLLMIGLLGSTSTALTGASLLLFAFASIYCGILLVLKIALSFVRNQAPQPAER